MDDVAAESHAVRSAPGWRRALAGLIDSAILAAVHFVRRLAQADSRRRRRSALEALIGPTPLLERVGSPGERLLGIQTVDRRTGQPVAWWRAALLTAAAVGVRALRTRLTPKPLTDEQRQRWAALQSDMQELRTRYADDPEALEAAMAELTRERRAPSTNAGAARALLAGVVPWFVSRQLTRRIAPTVVVLRRTRAHSP